MSKMEFFFEGHRAVIIKLLNDAKSQILVAMAYFTDEYLFRILLRRAQEGIKVHLIVRDDEVNTMSGIDYAALKSVGGYFDYNKSIHHKFCVIDAKAVLSGSYNWTNQAKSNHEDIILIDEDIQIAAMYITKFFIIKDPLRSFRRSRLQDFEGNRGTTLPDEKRQERRSGVLKRMRERKERLSKNTNMGQYTEVLYSNNPDSIASTVKAIVKPLLDFGFTGSKDKTEIISAFSILLGQRAQAAMFVGQTKGNLLLDTGVNVINGMYEECFVVDTDKYKLDLPMLVLTAMYLESPIKRDSLKVADTILKNELFVCVYQVCKNMLPAQVLLSKEEVAEAMTRFCSFLEKKYK